MLTERFQYTYTPKEEICIDETLVPFRGRLSFKKYIPNKRYKFGIKLYKLCLQGGYTYNLKVYCGKDKTGSKNISSATLFYSCQKIFSIRVKLYTQTIFIVTYPLHMSF